VPGEFPWETARVAGVTMNMDERGRENGIGAVAPLKRQQHIAINQEMSLGLSIRAGLNLLGVRRLHDITAEN